MRDFTHKLSDGFINSWWIAALSSATLIHCCASTAPSVPVYLFITNCWTELYGRMIITVNCLQHSYVLLLMNELSQSYIKVSFFWLLSIAVIKGVKMWKNIKYFSFCFKVSSKVCWTLTCLQCHFLCIIQILKLLYFLHALLNELFLYSNMYYTSSVSHNEEQYCSTSSCKLREIIKKLYYPHNPSIPGSCSLSVQR